MMPIELQTKAAVRFIPTERQIEIQSSHSTEPSIRRPHAAQCAAAIVAAAAAAAAVRPSVRVYQPVESRTNVRELAVRRCGASDYLPAADDDDDDHEHDDRDDSNDDDDECGGTSITVRWQTNARCHSPAKRLWHPHEALRACTCLFTQIDARVFIRVCMCVHLSTNTVQCPYTNHCTHNI